MNEQPESLRLADALEQDNRGYEPVTQAADELRRLYQLAMDQHTEIYGLRAEARLLKTVMVAAAEEIAAHWDAHCDEEGYGPVNLMHRLEKGIASEYAYKAGDFARLQEANKDLLEALTAMIKLYDAMGDPRGPTRIIAEETITKHGFKP